tara:strand:+ start:58181 stop:59161 length:981 start_codon:yes stop_codon:yes gene_type:complete
MHVTTQARKVFICLLLAFWLAGCVQNKTTPGYARAGDHIVIGLGGTNRNAGGEPLLTAADLTLTLTDANSVSHTLEPRFIFKSYLDYGAQVNTFSFDGTNLQVGLAGMVPFDGGWFVVAPLTYPGQYSSPLPLAVGPATVSVTSPKLINTANNIEGDQTAVPIEIIPGTSAQDVEYVRQFVGYVETPTNFIIRPNSLAGVTELGGAYFVINYNDESFFENGLEPMLVPVAHSPYVQLSYNVKPNGEGGGKIYATLLNPAGFTALGAGSPNSSLLADLAVKLIYFSDGTPAQAKTRFSIDPFNSYYVGLDGATLPGVSPTLTHAEDL